MNNHQLESARRTVMNCAKAYRDNLCDRQFIVIYRDRITNAIAYIEVVFLARNYQHLTGINLIGSDGRIIKNHSEDFYRRCVNNKLSISDIAFRKDGNTPLKLDALPAIVKFTSVTKIAGDSNNKSPYLYVDKLVGGVNVCLGLRLDDDTSCYVPVSALRKDIKQLTDNPSQVLTILERSFGSSEKYSTIKHVAKGTNLLSLPIPDDISELISLENYIAKT